MIGSGLKKFAQEQGLSVGRGVAYGSLGGFGATLSEGSGYKKIEFTTCFPDPAGKVRLMDQLNGVDLKKDYRAMSLDFTPKGLVVQFQDTVGTMKQIRAFVDWFLPMLREHGAAGVDICTECGCPITQGAWVLINGTAYHMHEGCVQKNQRVLDDANTRRAEAGGSYLMGLVGALLGAALGAVVWALVLLAGYVASIVGLLIGFLAEKGYNLLRGKQGKGKVFVLVIAVIVGVMLGTFGCHAIELVQMIQDGQLPGATLGDIPTLFGILFQDSEYIGDTVLNILMGLLFAALGVFGILRQAGKDVAADSLVRLDS